MVAEETFALIQIKNNKAIMQSCSLFLNTARDIYHDITADTFKLCYGKHVCE